MTLARSVVLFLVVCLPAAAQSLRITVIDVDQAAATLFVAPSGKTLLVDTGEDGHGSRIKAAMTRAGVSKIVHLVISHYHKDHLGGADELVAAPGAINVVNVIHWGIESFGLLEQTYETSKKLRVSYIPALLAIRNELGLPIDKQVFEEIVEARQKRLDDLIKPLLSIAKSATTMISRSLKGTEKKEGENQMKLSGDNPV